MYKRVLARDQSFLLQPTNRSRDSPPLDMSQSAASKSEASVTGQNPQEKPSVRSTTVPSHVRAIKGHGLYLLDGTPEVVVDQTTESPPKSPSHKPSGQPSLPNDLTFNGSNYGMVLKMDPAGIQKTLFSDEGTERVGKEGSSLDKSSKKK